MLCNEFEMIKPCSDTITIELVYRSKDFSFFYYLENDSVRHVIKNHSCNIIMLDNLTETMSHKNDQRQASQRNGPYFQ